MSPTEQDELRIIRESQIRMEGDIRALVTSHNRVKLVLHGDESDDMPGLIKRVDRLQQRNNQITGWLAAAWGVVTIALGTLGAWLLNRWNS